MAKVKALWTLALLLCLIAGGMDAGRAQTVTPTNGTPGGDGTLGSQGGPDLRLISPSSPLPAKARVNVYLEVLNLGPGAASDLSIHVDAADPAGLVIVGQLERNLQRLEVNDSDLLVVRVATPAEAGGARLLVTFRFRDDAGVLHTLTRSAGLQIATPTSAPLEATLETDTVETGRPSNVTFTLTNPTDRTLKDLDLTVSTQTTQSLVQIQNPDLTPAGESSQVIQGATLEPQSIARIVVPLRTSLAAEDLLLLTLKASYAVDGFRREQDFSFGVRAVGNIDVRVLEARQVPVGDGLEITATIVNAGTGTAWNPRVTTTEGSGLLARAPVLAEDLKPHEAVTVRIPVERVADPVPGAPLLSVEWDDSYGETTATSAGAAMEPLPPPTPGVVARFFSSLAANWIPLLIIALAAIGIVVLLVVIVRAMLHRKKGGEGGTKEARTPRPKPPKKEGKIRRPGGPPGQRPKPG